MTTPPPILPASSPGPPVHLDYAAVDAYPEVYTDRYGKVELVTTVQVLPGTSAPVVLQYEEDDVFTDQFSDRFTVRRLLTTVPVLPPGSGLAGTAAQPLPGSGPPVVLEYEEDDVFTDQFSDRFTVRRLLTVIPVLPPGSP